MVDIPQSSSQTINHTYSHRICLASHEYCAIMIDSVYAPLHTSSNFPTPHPLTIMQPIFTHSLAWIVSFPCLSSFIGPPHQAASTQHTFLVLIHSVSSHPNFWLPWLRWTPSLPKALYWSKILSVPRMLTLPFFSASYSILILKSSLQIR